MPERLDFITPKSMLVLEFFLDDPMQQSHEREVVRRVGVSKGSANKILNKLAAIGILTREKKGRMVFYNLNFDDPVARQFKVLQNVFSLRTLVNGLKEHSKKIVLFGSSSTGTDAKSSDIDVFVLTSSKDVVRRKVGEFNRQSSRKLTPIVVDSNEFVKLKHDARALHDNVQKGIVLWEIE